MCRRKLYMKNIENIDKERQDCYKQPTLCPYMESASTMRSCRNISRKKMVHVSEMKTSR